MPTIASNAQGLSASHSPLHVHPVEPGEEGQRQEDHRDDRDDQPALVDLFGAQVGQRFVRQRGALADALQFLGHARGAVGGGGQMQPVVVVEPADRERRELFERGALRRQEAAIADRLRADASHRAAQLEHLVGVELGLAFVEIVAQFGDIGVEVGGDRGGEFGDQVAGVEHLAVGDRLFDRIDRDQFLARDRDDAAARSPRCEPRRADRTRSVRRPTVRAG